MRTLTNIELTKKEYQYLKTRRLFDYGTESILYSEPSIFGSETVAKIWTSQLEYPTIQNKVEKLKRLYQIEPLDTINDVHILKTISYQKEIIGYLMNRTHYRDLNAVILSKEQLIDYLLLGYQKLEQLKQYGIFYFDISASNIMVSGNDLCFCDLDNISYQELPLDLMRESLETFVLKYKKLDEKAIAYMYNLLTMEMLCDLKDEYQVEEYFQTEQIPTEIEPRPYLYIRSKMQNLTTQYDGLYFIHYLKDTAKQKTKI